MLNLIMQVTKFYIFRVPVARAVPEAQRENQALRYYFLQTVFVSITSVAQSLCFTSLIIPQGTAGNDGPPGPPGERVSATKSAMQQKTLSPHHSIYSEMVYGLKRSERVLLQEAQ